jgi:hypothetical protein
MLFIKYIVILPQQEAYDFYSQTAHLSFHTRPYTVQTDQTFFTDGIFVTDVIAVRMEKTKRKKYVEVQRLLQIITLGRCFISVFLVILLTEVQTIFWARYKWKLETSEWTIHNGQSWDTGSIGYTGHKTRNNKTKTQHNMCWTPLCANKLK